MTTRKDRRVTIVVHTDGDLASRQYRVPVWAFEAGKWGALVVGLLVVLFFAFAGPIGRAAARVPVPPSPRQAAAYASSALSSASSSRRRHKSSHGRSSWSGSSGRAVTYRAQSAALQARAHS